MTAATAYCTTSAAFHQHSLTSPRSQFTPIPRRTTSSPSTSFTSSSSNLITHIEQSSIIKTIKSDENNNDQEIDDTSLSDSEGILYITSDFEDEDDKDDDISPTLDDDINQEEFLSFVGLRSKNKKPIAQNLSLQPLTKKFALPVCLLPIPKYNERVRQALYIQMPGLKFLSIIRNTDVFCTTDETAKAQSLLPRSIAQTRALSTLNKSPGKQRLAKTKFISMAANTFRSQRSRNSTDKYVNSILQCHVTLDRLDQSTIDQMMQKSPEENEQYITTSAISDSSLCAISSEIDPPLLIATDETTTTTTRTTITTMTTEKTVVKRKSTKTTDRNNKSKRFKSGNSEHLMINDNDTKLDLSSITYDRIYLKCFVCSKREYIDAKVIGSDVLHSHWVEHDGDLSLNIYDSEIDSILTRVVEFFNSPKQYMLEGKIKTVFILDSKEIRCKTTTATSQPTSDDCIVID